MLVPIFEHSVPAREARGATVLTQFHAARPGAGAARLRPQMQPKTGRKIGFSIFLGPHARPCEWHFLPSDATLGK
jgi:hypothetical protein